MTGAPFEQLIRAADWVQPADLRNALFDPRGIILERNTRIFGAGTGALGAPLLIGRNTYHLSGRIGGWCVIGRYCSFSNYVDLAAAMPQGGSLATGDLSTAFLPATAPADRPPLTVIGCDVWMGVGVCIRQGARIGHGAVIGAHAVVTGEIPPYAVAAGDPARVVRHRFAPALVERLLAAAWWCLPADLAARLPRRDVEACLRIAEGYRRGR